MTYDDLPLEAKKEVVTFIQLLLNNYGDKVPKQPTLLRCIIAGIPENIAKKVIETETLLNNQELVCI